jgi:hypothetical protein
MDGFCLIRRQELVPRAGLPDSSRKKHGSHCPRFGSAGQASRPACWIQNLMAKKSPGIVKIPGHVPRAGLEPALTL